MRGAWLRRWLVLGLAVVACLALVVVSAAADSSLTENVTPGDAVSAVAGASSSIGENVTPGDAVSTHAGASSSVGENVTPADAVATHPGQSSSVGENVTPSDAVVLTPGARIDIGENVAPRDAVSFLQGALLQLTENVSPHDAADLQIVNTVPKLILPGLLRSKEGEALVGSGSFEDPDTQAWSATVNWGDGTPVEPLQLAFDKTFRFDHVYDDNAPQGYMLTVVLSDGLATVTGSVHVEVANVAPVAALANDGPVDEGSPATISFANQFDPSHADTAAGFTYAYDCGSGYGTPSPSPTGKCTFDDQGSYVVTAKIADKDGGSTELTTSVDVTNVAPTATFDAPATIAEGSPATLAFSGQLDPSKADSAAGFTYAYDCGSGYGAPTADATATCTFDDGPSTQVVRGKILDKDGGATEYTRSIEVTNVAPTATLSNSGPVAEGSPATVSFTGAQDPSQADTTAGFAYAFACDGAALGPLTPDASTTCTFDDGPSTHTVTARIADKDGGFTDYTTDVVVQNVAPTATLTAPASVDEGSPIALSLGGVHDPSAADTAAGFAYAFDCGDGAGLSAFGPDPTASCPTTDNGTRVVRAAVRDKDGDSSTYTATVAVQNVAPTATLVAPTSANEGGTFTVSLTGPADPSTADTAAGFMYSFDCGSGYGAPSPTSSALCTAVDDPGVDVKAKITDKDGGSTEYTSHVVIANLPPVVQIAGPPAGSSYPVGSTVALSGSFTDPGVKDTHTAQWSLDALTTPGAVTETNGSGSVGGSYTFTTPGVYSVTLTVTDNAGAAGSATTVGGAPALIVVFDPNNGQATGGGWVGGSDKAKTTFAFTAKYQKGSLGGNVTAQLPSGSLKATALQWLVVAGSKLQLRGDATLDGAAGYSFLLTATVSPDAFRLKVWRTGDGSVVYDNVPGASDDIDLASPQPLGGGNIAVH